MKLSPNNIIAGGTLPILLAFATPLFAQNPAPGAPPPPPRPGAPGGGLPPPVDPAPRLPGAPGGGPPSAPGAPGAGLPGAPGGPAAPGGGRAAKSATPEQILARDTEIEVIKTHLKQVNDEIQALEEAPAASAPEQEK